MTWTPAIQHRSPLAIFGLILLAGCSGGSAAEIRTTPVPASPAEVTEVAEVAEAAEQASIEAEMASIPASEWRAPRSGVTEAAITPADVMHRVGLLAHDSMRGRDAGSPEKARAAAYLAAEAERLGLVPLGSGNFLQPVPLIRRQTDLSIARFLADGAGSPAEELSPLVPGEDLVVISGLGGLPGTSRQVASGPLIFGGHLYDPDLPVGTLPFEDLQGSMVIVRMEPPEGAGDPALLPPRMEIAFLFGPQSPAAGVILVAEGDLEDFFPYAADTGPKGAVALAGGDEPGDLPPFFLITPEALERLLATPISEARLPRTGLGELSIALETTTTLFEDHNVVAVLPGSDPARRHELMTLGAHYDHVGVGTPVEGDSIFNGADDNASGTSALLEVAEHLVHLPVEARPARSVLFIWHAAEELGLLGSEFFMDNPVVARSAMVAHINMDMVGRNHPDSLFIVGSRRLSRAFGDWVEEANAQLPAPFALDYSYDAPGHPEQLYCRSDHWNFARYGIPVVKMGSGLHDDYHKPSDSVDRINAEKVARVASFATAITLEVTRRPDRPLVDGPIPNPMDPCQG